MKDLWKLIAILVLATLAAVVTVSHSGYNKKEQPLQRSLAAGEITQNTSTQGLTDEERLSQCLSDKMCKYLAEAGYWESRSEPDKGVKAVMFVILQRVADERRWGDSVKAVLRQPKQFEYVSRGLHLKGFAEKQRYKEIVLIAHGVVNGAILNPVPRANHFHTTNIKRAWTKKMREVAVIGNHAFFEG